MQRVVSLSFPIQRCLSAPRINFHTWKHSISDRSTKTFISIRIIRCCRVLNLYVYHYRYILEIISSISFLYLNEFVQTSQEQERELSYKISSLKFNQTNLHHDSALYSAWEIFSKVLVFSFATPTTRALQSRHFLPPSARIIARLPGLLYPTLALFAPIPEQHRLEIQPTPPSTATENSISAYRQSSCLPSYHSFVASESLEIAFQCARAIYYISARQPALLYYTTRRRSLTGSLPRASEILYNIPSRGYING